MSILAILKKPLTLLSSEHTMKKNSGLHDNRIEYEDFLLILACLLILIGIYEVQDDEMRLLYGSIRYSEKKFVVLIIGNDQDIDSQRLQ